LTISNEDAFIVNVLIITKLREKQQRESLILGQKYVNVEDLFVRGSTVVYSQHLLVPI